MQDDTEHYIREVREACGESKTKQTDIEVCIQESCQSNGKCDSL